MERLKKLFVWLLPILVLVLIFIIFSAKQLANLDQSPTKGWSRSIALPMSHMSDTSHLYTSTSGKNTTIYGETSQGIVKLTVNPKLTTVAKKTFAIHPDYQPLWANGDTLVYIKDGKLTLYKDGKASTLDPNATILLPLKNKVAYAYGNTLKIYNPTIGKIKTIAHFKLPISELNKSANNNDMTVATNQKKVTNVYYFQNNKGSFKKYFVHHFNDPGSLFNNFMFSVKNGVLHLVYSNTRFAGGVATLYFTNEIPIHSLTGNSMPLPQNMISIYTDNHDYVKNPSDFYYYVVNGKDYLSFTKDGTLSYKNDGHILYVAPLSGTTAIGTPYSTNNLSINPDFVKPGLIVWLGFDQDHNYQLYGATTNPKAVASSLVTTKQDISSAISSGLILMSINIFVVFFALVYILPAFVYYLICYFVNSAAVEKGSRVVWWGSYIVYFICMIIFFNSFLILKLIPQELPVYLNFPGSVYIILIIFSLISLAITRFVKTEFWERLPIFIYFAVINTLFVTMFLGGYTFPTMYD